MELVAPVTCPTNGPDAERSTFQIGHATRILRGQRIFPAIAAARLTAEWPMRFDRRLAAAGLVPPLCRSAAPLTAGLSSRGAARSVLRGPVLRCNAVVRRAVFRRAVFRRAVVRGP